MVAKTIDKDNKFKITILTYVLLFVILFGVCNTSIYNANLVPFGISIVFSLIYINFNGFYLSLVYIISYMLANLSFISVLEVLNVVFILCLLEYLKRKNNFKLKKWLVFVFSFLSQIVYIACNVGNTNQNLALMISIILGGLFLYSNICFFNATLNRGLFVKLNLDEKICGSVILIIFTIGMSCCNISIINLGLIISSLIILVTTYILSSGITVIVSAIMGIGFSLTSGNPLYISLFVFISLCSISFKCSFKYFSIVGLSVGYVIFCLFFNMGITYGELISILLGGIIFAFVPFKILYSVSAVFNIKSTIVYKNILNKSKQQIVKRVNELSSVFSEMDKVYRNMIRGNLPKEKAIDMLKEELMSSVCNNCANKNKCFRGELSFLENSIETIVSVGYEKGKLLLVDLPVYLTSNCININTIINNLNSMLVSYKEYVEVVSNLDTGRSLIADQLNGVSKLLIALGKEVDTNISFDTMFESKIKEELSYKNIICLECVVYEKDITSKYVELVVKTNTINDKIIEKTVSKALNNNLIIKSIEPAEVMDASLVTLNTRPNYDIAFGSSSVSKMGKKVCGDSQSLVKLEDGKYMVTICDGMGSGSKAHSISNLTISLIENFYRAGFDNDIILSSVNKLLSLTEDENFSTIDLCIIDGKKNIYDFIKLGATSGYLKRDNGECEEIKSSDLPIGVLEEIRPHITKKLINAYDMLVFVSDGVSDSFEGKKDLRTMIANSNIINPQTLSEEILREALELNSNIAKDDMTVVCVRVFNNF